MSISIEITDTITKLNKQNKELYTNNQLLLELISNILQINKDPDIDRLIKNFLVNKKCI